MKAAKFAGIIFMIFLMAVSSASAALYVNVVSDDFSIESPYPVSTVKECECGTRIDPITITNHGDFDAVFTVQVFSPIAQYITLSRQTFSLKSSEATEIYAYINAPCDTSVTSNYVISVSTNYGRSKDIYKEFESKKCQNIQFTSRMLNDIVNPGDTAMVEVELQNVAGFEETYNIQPTNNYGYSYVSRDQVTLEPDQKTKVLIYTAFPVEVYGTVDQTFQITSQKANNVAYGSETFEIAKDYDFTIKTEELSIDVCEDVTTNSEITIQNLAGTPNEYSLELRGPAFAQISTDTMPLAANERGIVELTVTPTKLDIGEYELTLRANTKYGNMAKDKSIKLIVNNCFDSSASINGANAIISEKACGGEKEYTLNLVNRGKFEEAYQVIVDSEGWLNIDSSNEFVRLRPGQQVNIAVKASLPSIDMKKTSFVTVKQLRAPYETHEFRIDLESYSQATCHNVELVDQSLTTNYDGNAIPLILQNTGLKGGNYNLALGELDSKFVSLVENNITINPGELQVVHIIPSNYSNYSEGRYLNQLSLNIKPDSETIHYERQFWINLQDKNFFEKALDYLKRLNYNAVGFCGLFGIFLLLVIILLVTSVFYMKSGKFKTQRIKADRIKKLRIVNMVLIGLILLFLVILLFMKGPDSSSFYEQATNKTGPLYHEWKANTAYHLELGQYFEDPDATDVLTYTATQPDHIQVTIDGSQATLTPEHGWNGTEYIVFEAVDPSGDSAVSRPMTLHVMQKKPMTWIEYWGLYCCQINVILLIAIIILILFMTDILEEKGYRKYLPKTRKK